LFPWIPHISCLLYATNLHDGIYFIDHACLAQRSVYPCLIFLRACCLLHLAPFVVFVLFFFPRLVGGRGINGSFCWVEGKICCICMWKYQVEGAATLGIYWNRWASFVRSIWRGKGLNRQSILWICFTAVLDCEVTWAGGKIAVHWNVSDYNSPMSLWHEILKPFSPIPIDVVL